MTACGAITTAADTAGAGDTISDHSATRHSHESRSHGSGDDKHHDQPIAVIVSDELDQPSVTVDPGLSITWENSGDDRIRVRSVSGPGKFDSGNLEPGEEFEHRFTKPGTYEYYDHRNRDDEAFQGVVVVRPESDGAGDVSGADSAVIAEPIGMDGERFSPGYAMVSDTVEWVNDDDEKHTVTALDGSFDSGALSTGETFTFTAPEPGTYSYVCAYHPDMTGTIEVLESGEVLFGEHHTDDPAGKPGQASRAAGAEESFGPQLRIAAAGAFLLAPLGFLSERLVIRRKDARRQAG